jgi:hypothetical protein
MRFLISFFQSSRPHPTLGPYKHWEWYVKQGIEESGHTWVDVPGVDWAAGLACAADLEALAVWRAEAWERAVRFAREEHARNPIDVFLTYLFPSQVDVEAIEEVRRIGIPCVNFFCDNIRNFRHIPAEFSPFDLHWVPEYAALKMYRQAGFPTVWAAMPCWVHPSLRTWDHEETLPATFVGSRDGPRERLFQEVIPRLPGLELRGVGWASRDELPPFRGVPASIPELVRRQVQYVRNEGVAAFARKFLPAPRPVPDVVFAGAVRPAPGPDEYARTMQEATIALGVNRYESLRHSVRRPHAYSRLRDIEAPMMGACYLTEWCEGLDQMYDLDHEVAAYRTADELVAQIEALLGDPARRRRMRRDGQRRALADHTVGESLRRIATALNLVDACV